MSPRGRWDREVGERRTPEDSGRADLLREGVERERGDDCTRLAARGRHSVRGGAEARREDLRGVALCAKERRSAAYVERTDRRVRT